MTFQEALEHRENVTGHSVNIGGNLHVYLVVPDKKEDFLKYTVDYFTKYKHKIFTDNTAKEYSSNDEFTVTNFMVVRE